MILILEGPNKSGKTTLAKYLKEKEKMFYFKDFRTSEFTVEENIKVKIENDIKAQIEVLKSFNNQGIDIVVDRFHITEKVYGKKFRNYESDSVKIANELFKDEDVGIIFLGRFEEGYEDSKTKELMSEYYSIMQNENRLPYINFDVKYDSVIKIKEFIEKTKAKNLKMIDGKVII